MSATTGELAYLSAALKAPRIKAVSGRLAERARAGGGGLAAGLLLAAARSEQGQVEPAADALRQAADQAVTHPEQLGLLLAEFGLALWVRRDVRRARQVLDRARSALPRGASWGRGRRKAPPPSAARVRAPRPPPRAPARRGAGGAP